MNEMEQKSLKIPTGSMFDFLIPSVGVAFIKTLPAGSRAVGYRQDENGDLWFDYEVSEESQE